MNEPMQRRSVTALVLASVLLNGCATTIYTHGDLSEPSQLSSCDGKRSVDLRSFDWADYWASVWAEKNVILWQTPELRQTILAIAEDSKCFSKVNKITFSPDRMQFIEDSKSDSKTPTSENKPPDVRAGEFLNTSATQVSARSLARYLQIFKFQAPILVCSWLHHWGTPSHRDHWINSCLGAKGAGHESLCPRSQRPNRG
jgi:hypothetical protein